MGCVAWRTTIPSLPTWRSCWDVWEGNTSRATARVWGALGGVVLSASHNSFEDNGIKFFSADGFKLPDAQEDQIEQMIRSGVRRPSPTGRDLGRIRMAADA